MFVKHNPQNIRIINGLLRENKKFPIDFQKAKVMFVPNGIADTLFRRSDIQNNLTYVDIRKWETLLIAHCFNSDLA